MKLDYELRDADGQVIEDEGAQLEYLHGGFGGIFPKVEEALEDKQSGSEVALTSGVAETPSGEWRRVDG